MVFGTPSFLDCITKSFWEEQNMHPALVAASGLGLDPFCGEAVPACPPPWVRTSIWGLGG